MSNSDNVRKLELECVRMAADCMQLARAARDPAQQARFVRMAEAWTGLAAHGPQHGTPHQIWN